MLAIWKVGLQLHTSALTGFYNAIERDLYVLPDGKSLIRIAGLNHRSKLDVVGKAALLFAGSLGLNYVAGKAGITAGQLMTALVSQGPAAAVGAVFTARAFISRQHMSIPVLLRMFSPIPPVKSGLLERDVFGKPSRVVPGNRFEVTRISSGNFADTMRALEGAQELADARHSRLLVSGRNFDEHHALEMSGLEVLAGSAWSKNIRTYHRDPVLGPERPPSPGLDL